jgi:hypothetical protein
MLNSNLYDSEISRILLHYNKQGDASVELVLQAFKKGFCIRGSAFFAVNEIKNFLSDLRNFPLNQSSMPLLSGGYFDDIGKKIISEHFHISVLQIDSSGLLAMRISGFTPYAEYYEKDFGFGGRSTYFLYYEGLKKFSDELERLIDGRSVCFEFRDFNDI